MVKFKIISIPKNDAGRIKGGEGAEDPCFNHAAESCSSTCYINGSLTYYGVQVMINHLGYSYIIPPVLPPSPK
jgi:hypothetical protein